MQKFFQKTGSQLFKQLNQTTQYSVVTVPNFTKNTSESFKQKINVINHDNLEQQNSIPTVQQEALKKTQLDWQYSNENSVLLAFQKEEKKPEKRVSSLRQLASKCVKSLQGRKIQDCDIEFSEGFSQAEINEFLNAFVLTNYKFQIKGNKISQEKQEEQEQEEKKPLEIQNINLLNEQIDINDTDFQFKIASARATLYAREYGNQRANVGTTEYFFEECQKLVKEYPQVQMEFVKGQDLEKKGMNLHYSVGKASVTPPIAVNLTYKGNPNSEEQLALVGKGLTFDAGGLNLKPTGFIENMYVDKQGACNVLGILKGVLEQNLKINLTCSIGLAENFVANNSFRPSDIIKAYNGLTVEIGNTDAEGRLVLADVICWTNELHSNIKTMIEMSTLTGACAIALGSKTAGIFTNSDKLAQDLVQSGLESDEQIWRMPIFDDHREAVKGQFADINNADKKDRYGGASKAAAFLENFFDEKQEWCHMDIAGPSDFPAANGTYSAGASAFGVQTVFNYLRKQQQQ